MRSWLNTPKWTGCFQEVSSEKSLRTVAGGDGVSTLFVPLDELGEGHHRTITLGESDLPGLGRLAGIDRVLPVDRLKDEMSRVSTLFTPHQPAEHATETRGTVRLSNRYRAQDEWELDESREERLIGLLRKRFPEMTIRDLSPTLDSMRLIKSPAEIRVMREAARLTCMMINECMRATEPGMSRHKIPAIGKYVYWLLGQCPEGYDYLVTTSTEDSDTLVDGDLVLMDCGHEDPLRPGMVIVVDPMIWLEDVPHTYVRVEDTVVITDDGCERLTADSAPPEVNSPTAGHRKSRSQLPVCSSRAVSGTSNRTSSRIAHSRTATPATSRGIVNDAGSILSRVSYSVWRKPKLWLRAMNWALAMPFSRNRA
jgi:hypothetical protein